MVLIVGSTGFVGTAICRLLAEQKTPFRALVRADSATEKVELLTSLGAELAVGDLKDPASLAAACAGVTKIISTASSTFSAREGDNIESVDHQGQLNLVEAANKAGVERFVFISFPDNTAHPNPLSDAKRAVEIALAESNMVGCSLQANYFTEVWLSPHLGFDYANAKARVYGSGDNKVSWVSLVDVARFAVAALDKNFAANQLVNIGGPEPLSQNEAIRLFEAAHGKTFEVEYVPEAALEQQLANSTHPLEQSFTGLMLQYAAGMPMDMSKTAAHIDVPLTSVADYAAATKA